MTAEILRACPGCGGTLIATATFRNHPELIEDGAPAFFHHWMHRTPEHDNDCPLMDESPSLKPNPANVNRNQSMAQVINVDFKNKKRLD
jgi:hypothetical protein